MFTTINTYNDLHNNLLFNFYYVSKLKIDTKIDSLKKIYNIEYDITELNTIIDELYKRICATILCDSEIKIEQFLGPDEVIPKGKPYRTATNKASKEKDKNKQKPIVRPEVSPEVLVKQRGLMKKISSNNKFIRPLKEKLLPEWQKKALNMRRLKNTTQNKNKQGENEEDSNNWL
jgi:hypothetical protein